MRVISEVDKKLLSGTFLPVGKHISKQSQLVEVLKTQNHLERSTRVGVELGWEGGCLR